MSFPIPDLSLFEEYALMLRSQNKSAGTVKEYTDKLRFITQNATTIEEFFADPDLKNKSLKAAAYRSYAKFLQYKKIITREDLMDIQDTIKSPRIRGNHRDEKKWHVPKENWNEYIERAPNQVAKMGIWIGFNFGLRRGEIVNLRVQDVDLVKREVLIQIREDWQPKCMRERQIPMNNEQATIFERWINEYRAPLNLKHDYLLWVPDQSHTNISKKFTQVKIDTFHRWAKKTGLITKNLRYSFARWFYEASTHDIKLTSKMMGHEKVSTTADYLEVAHENMMSKARAVFEQ